MGKVIQIRVTRVKEVRETRFLCTLRFFLDTVKYDDKTVRASHYGQCRLRKSIDRILIDSIMKFALHGNPFSH